MHFFCHWWWLWPTPILRKLYTALTLISIVFIPLQRLSLVVSIWDEAENLWLISQCLHLICINLASPFFLSSISSNFRAEQFWQVNKENTCDRMDKSMNLNFVSNVESFESSTNSTLSVEIAQGSNAFFTFVKIRLISTSSSALASSITTGLEAIFSLYWDFFSFWETFFCSPV